MLAMSVLAMGLVSCSSCATTSGGTTSTGPEPSASVTSSSTGPGPSANELVVSKDNWTMVLPGNSWDSLAEDCSDPQNPSYCQQSVFLQNGGDAVVVLLSEEFDGPFDTYVISAIRGIKDADANIDSTTSVELDGHNFVLIESSKEDVKVWTWASLIAGLGYGLSCGGPAETKDLCFGVASSLKIE